MNELETERALLGNLLLKAGNTLPLVEEAITAANFSSDQHANLWSWIQRTRKANRSADVAALLATFNQDTLRRKFGGADYIEQMGDAACVDRQMGELAERIADQARTRMLQAHLQHALSQVGTRPVAEIISDHERRIMRLGEVAGKSSQVMHISEYASAAQEKAQRMADGDTSVDYIPTGFPTLDKQIIGWPVGTPTLIGGRPAMGKTAVILAAALRGASESHGGGAHVQGIISLEMTGSKLLYRLASTWSGVSSKRVFSGEASSKEKHDFNEAFSLIGQMPIVMDDSSWTLPAVVTSIQRMARIHGVRVVYIDYFQLLKLTGGETRDLDRAADELRNAAKAEDVALVLLSQLNRECEKTVTRGRKGVPHETHFRGTDKLLHDAGLAFAVYREFHYHPPNKTSGERYHKNELSRLHQPVELINLKAREGGESVELNVQLNNGRVFDHLDEGYSWTPWHNRAGTHNRRQNAAQGQQEALSYAEQDRTPGVNNPWGA